MAVRLRVKRMRRKHKLRVKGIKLRMKPSPNFMEILKNPSNCICDEVIISKILPRLTAKPLFRFKSVCKKWNHVISSDMVFARDQSRCCRASSGLFYKIKGPWKQGFITVSEDLVGFPCPLLALIGKEQEIMASCNGLLCCRSKVGVTHRLFKICNPVTRECKNVKLRKYFKHVGFAFDPENPDAGFFIVCPEMQATHNNQREAEYLFDMYSSKDDSWRVSGEKAIVLKDGWYDDGTQFAGGKIHWHVKTTVLSFDPYKEISYVTPLPDDGTHSIRHKWCLGQIGGNLSCIKVTERTELQIWVLRDFEWDKTYCVSLAVIFRGNLDFYDLLTRDGTRHVNGKNENKRNCDVKGKFGEGEAKEEDTVRDGDEKKVKKKGGMKNKSKALKLVRQCNMYPLPSICDDIIFLWICRRVFSYNLASRKLTELYLSRTSRPHYFFPYVNSLSSLVESTLS